MTMRARLRRHPIAIEAHLRDCLTLTYACPADVLRPLLPPGLELDTLGGFGGFGFVAIALVQTEALRPAGMPRVMGQDFLLAGYRIFTRFRAPHGTTLRGLRILRSDTNRLRMVLGGNMLTHYNYHRCDARLDVSGDSVHIEIQTPDRLGDLDVTAHLREPVLPEGSPFASVREARRFAGPLPYTFDYERETHSIIAVKATRTKWQPAPVSADVRRVRFFEQPAFASCRPALAAAFHVGHVEYRWERGVRYALPEDLPPEGGSHEIEGERSVASAFRRKETT